MKTEKSNDEVFIDRVLGELYDYTQYHFRSEEKAFIGTDYPFLREHIKAHIEFTETVKKMVAEKTKIGASLNAIRIAHAASTWIIQHVIRFDRGYAVVMVVNMLMAVPRTVTISVFLRQLKNSVFSRIYSIVSNWMAFGVK